MNRSINSNFPDDPLPTPDEIATLEIQDVEISRSRDLEFTEDDLDSTPLKVGELTKLNEESSDNAFSGISPPERLSVDPHTGELILLPSSSKITTNESANEEPDNQ